MRYFWPEEKLDSDGLMVEKDRYDVKRNAVTYMSDELGLHRVENPSHSDGAVSLHLYSPPFQSCQVRKICTSLSTKLEFFQHTCLSLDFRWENRKEDDLSDDVLEQVWWKSCQESGQTNGVEADHRIRQKQQHCSYNGTVKNQFSRKKILKAKKICTFINKSVL